MVGVFQSDLIFSMADESLDCLSDFRYRNRAEALNALLVQYAHLRIISSEFGVSWILWRGSRDHCLFADSCLVSLNLFECRKCRLVAVSVARWTWLVSVVMIVWILQLFSCIFAGSVVDERESNRLGAGPLSWGFVDVTWAWVSVPACPFSVFILLQGATPFQADIISAVWGLLAGKCPIVVRSKCQRKDWSRDHGPSCADGRPRQANVPAKGWCVDMRFEKLGIIMPVVSYDVYMRLVG
jgi:hypothetical protein